MKNLLIAILSGLLLAFGWPTYGFPMLLFVAVVPLLLVEHRLRISEIKRKGLKIFGLSYLTFFIWNLITTSWLRYADVFGASFAVLVNSALMASLVLIYHKFALRNSQNRALLFLVTLWISFEKLHLGWEFSWPWLNLGNGFSEYFTWIQWDEYTGTFGGTLWVWLLNVILFKGFLLYRKGTSKVVLKRLVLTSASLIIIPIGISLVLLNSYSHTGETVNVIALQPNIDPYSEKYNMTNINFSELFEELSNSKITDATDFVIAPETFFAESARLRTFENSFLKNKLDQYVSEHPNVNLLTGISFIDVFSDPKRIRKETNTYNKTLWYDDYNSAILINSSDSTQYYNKSKLVVGIENFPYQDILKPIMLLTIVW